VTDETRQEIARQLAIELGSRTVIPPRRPGQGFKTFGEFKRAMGAAGTGKLGIILLDKPHQTYRDLVLRQSTIQVTLSDSHMEKDQFTRKSPISTILYKPS
jgi:hypothetical protein